MAYARSGLRQLSNNGVNRHWQYLSGGDSTATCDTAAYFNNAAGLLKVNDIIEVIPTSAPSGRLVVNSNTRDLTASPMVSGVVDTTSTTAFGTADSD